MEERDNMLGIDSEFMFLATPHHSRAHRGVLPLLLGKHDSVSAMDMEE
jgi:hypothetical protein